MSNAQAGVIFEISPSIIGNSFCSKAGSGHAIFSSAPVGTLDQYGALPFLGAFWRSPDHVHQIGALDRQTGKFKNIVVSGAAQAVSYALTLSDAGTEAYFAPAEYRTAACRLAINVVGAFALWMDIDCSEANAAAGKGYSTVVDAEIAVRQFCIDSGLPEPTHIVSSGGGLHGYWVLDRMVDRENWQTCAKKLKALTKSQGLLADNCRTGDIASVLRIPGTLNYKYDPPRLVTLRYAADTFIEYSVMRDAIDSAYDRKCSITAAKRILPFADSLVPTVAGKGHTFRFGPVIFARLESALFVLDPDCDDETWKLRRIAPMAGAAKQHPEWGEALYTVARSWSSGELQGQASVAWVTPGGNGKSGEEIFDSVWQRFLRSEYAGTPITIGTIFYDAKAAGWDPSEADEEAFEKCETEVVEAA